MTVGKDPDVARSACPVSDQDRDRLLRGHCFGFDKRLDRSALGGGRRWIEVGERCGHLDRVVAARGGHAGGVETGIRSWQPTRTSARRDAGQRPRTRTDVLRLGRVPPMFPFRDPDGLAWRSSSSAEPAPTREPGSGEAFGAARRRCGGRPTGRRESRAGPAPKPPEWLIPEPRPGAVGAMARTLVPVGGHPAWSSIVAASDAARPSGGQELAIVVRTPRNMAAHCCTVISGRGRPRPRAGRAAAHRASRHRRGHMSARTAGLRAASSGA